VRRNQKHFRSALVSKVIKRLRCDDTGTRKACKGGRVTGGMERGKAVYAVEGTRKGRWKEDKRWKRSGKMEKRGKDSNLEREKSWNGEKGFERGPSFCTIENEGVEELSMQRGKRKELPQDAGMKINKQHEEVKD